MIARRLTIRGRVQGVGFRYSLCEEAEKLGVTGWVRNRRDGSVEALVQGSSQQVDQMIAWARRGPSGARVDEVQVEPDEDGSHSGFELRPTI